MGPNLMDNIVCGFGDLENTMMIIDYLNNFNKKNYMFKTKVYDEIGFKYYFRHKQDYIYRDYRTYYENYLSITYQSFSDRNTTLYICTNKKLYEAIDEFGYLYQLIVHGNLTFKYYGILYSNHRKFTNLHYDFTNNKIVNNDDIENQLVCRSMYDDKDNNHSLLCIEEPTSIKYRCCMEKITSFNLNNYKLLYNLFN